MVMSFEGNHPGDVTREPKLSRGPEYANRYRKPSLLAESSDQSSSSRTSGRPLQVRQAITYAIFMHSPVFTNTLLQKSFKSMVAARDGVCLLTGRQPPHRLDAAHIVPQSRPDVSRISQPSQLSPSYLTKTAGLPTVVRYQSE